MWIISSTNKVIKSPKGITIDNIQHPKEIFRSWSIDALKDIGIKYFREESYDSFKYNSTGYTDNDTGDEIVREHTLVERTEYLDDLKQSQYKIIKASMDNELLEGVTVTVGETDYKMDCTELDIIKLQNGIFLSESNSETTISIIDYDNNYYEDVPLTPAKNVLRQTGLHWRTLNQKRITLRNQIVAAANEAEVLVVVW